MNSCQREAVDRDCGKGMRWIGCAQPSPKTRPNALAIAIKLTALQTELGGDLRVRLARQVAAQQDRALSAKTIRPSQIGLGFGIQVVCKLFDLRSNIADDGPVCNKVRDRREEVSDEPVSAKSARVVQVAEQVADKRFVVRCGSYIGHWP